jgi:hypothetical protein
MQMSACRVVGAGGAQIADYERRWPAGSGPQRAADHPVLVSSLMSMAIAEASPYHGTSQPSADLRGYRHGGLFRHVFGVCRAERPTVVAGYEQYYRHPARLAPSPAVRLSRADSRYVTSPAYLVLACVFWSWAPATGSVLGADGLSRTFVVHDLPSLLPALLALRDG